jgi:L-alanine-DL-glutamate epimerase-like enolase superfamily enzyme
MKITRIEVFELEAPLEKPWRIATFELKSLLATLVRVHTDEGLTGIGECIVRLGPGATRAVVEEVLAPVVVGRDAFDIEGIWDDMYRTMRARGHSRGYLLEAISGIDIALWDLLGKKLGLPVSKLLAGHGRRELSAYASSILLDTPAVMAKEAARLAAEGYTAIKMKVGGGHKVDIARMDAVRAAVGANVDVMLDANSGYDAPTAIAVGQHAEKLGVFWLEEPVVPDDLPGYKRIRDAVKGVRLAAGEGEFTAAGFRPFLEAGLLDVVQPDIARAGGFTGCRRVAALADVYNVAVAPHTGASGPICIAASLHFAAATPRFLIFEQMYIYNPLREILAQPLPQPKSGVIAVPTAPGLGVELNEAAVKRFLRVGPVPQSISLQ